MGAVPSLKGSVTTRGLPDTRDVVQGQVGQGSCPRCRTIKQRRGGGVGTVCPALNEASTPGCTGDSLVYPRENERRREGM